MSFEGGPVNLITEINETDNDLTLHKPKHGTKVRHRDAGGCWMNSNATFYIVYWRPDMIFMFPSSNQGD